MFIVVLPYVFGHGVAKTGGRRMETGTPMEELHILNGEKKFSLGSRKPNWQKERK